jgi:hypothetical protein
MSSEMHEVVDAQPAYLLASGGMGKPRVVWASLAVTDTGSRLRIDAPYHAILVNGPAPPTSGIPNPIRVSNAFPLDRAL